MARLLRWHSHTDGQTPLITVKQTSKLLGQQTPRSGCRQFLYTAAHGRPIQALANQRPQLQLRLQLVRMQPSSNRIKTRTSSRLAALTAPLSTRERHISSNSQRQQIRPISTTSASIISSSVLGGSSSWQLVRAATLHTVDSRPYLRRQHTLAPRSTQQRYAQ
jgi:hypothetical protein